MNCGVVMNFFVLLFQFNTISATVINAGTINTDYTFSLTNSPYIVTGSVVFTDNVYIENGVKIIYPANTGFITIKGNINAGCNDIDTMNHNGRGLVDQNIFTHIYANLSFSHGLIIIDSTQNITNEIKFCNVKFSNLEAGLGIKTPLYSDIYIDNCEFIGNHYSQAYLYNAITTNITYITDTIITNTKVMVNSYGNAIYDNCDIQEYDQFCNPCIQISIRNSRLVRNSTDSTTSSKCLSVGSSIGDEHLAFYNNIISHCGIGLFPTNNYYVSNNIFTNIHYRAIYHIYTDIVITNNIFKNSMLGQIFYLTSANLNATIIGNTFINNVASGNELIYIEGANVYRSRALFENNIFINNQATNRFFTVSVSYTHLINNEFRDNIAASAFVSNVVVDKAAFYFSARYTDWNTITFLNNNFQGNTWNTYFIYTNPDRTRENIFEYNIFNDTFIGSSASILSLAIKATVRYNTFIPPSIPNHLGTIISFTSFTWTNFVVQFNNFYNAFASIFFIEFDIASTTIDNNYFDGIIDVNQILNKTNPEINSASKACHAIQPFYKDPIINISNLPTQCLFDSSYSANCIYNGNIIGCITSSPTAITQPPTDNTQQPTLAPTKVPTQIPTMNTMSPTKYPTYSTSNPSASPTQIPTISPTAITSIPTQNPAESTLNPSTSPTGVPTASPTEITATPTRVTATPSESTSNPTAVTLMPSTVPTKMPTANPNKSDMMSSTEIEIMIESTFETATSRDVTVANSADSISNKIAVGIVSFLVLTFC